ncbi:hypothetical protein [uncultured Metabacillus sp.]|uniref:hypothetical protein n=1 Tax=uncultured Metabacillus sp. TaxID=2860135 RepID=UPI00260BDF79|nr:hypothetical protein [uncultured Metabacillus sp.]
MANVIPVTVVGTKDIVVASIPDIAYKASRICILEGKNSTYQYHNLCDEVWTTVKSEGELALVDNIHRIKAVDIIHLPTNKKHGIYAITELEFIEVQTNGYRN